MSAGHLLADQITVVLRRALVSECISRWQMEVQDCRRAGEYGTKMRDLKKLLEVT